MRTLPALKLHHSPLVLALAQVKFAPILQMEEHVPPIQERLRHQGFPKFVAKQIQEMIFGPAPIVNATKRWLFSNKDKTQTVVLSHDAIAVVATVYDVFEDFAQTFRSVLELVGTEAQVALSDRVGLRYVDVIRLSGGESYRDYVQGGLHGPAVESLGASNALIQSQLKAHTSIGTLVVRLWQSQDGRFLPPDLQNQDVAHQIQPKAGELLTILDIDHFTAREREYSPDLLMQDLWSLHDGTDRTFRNIVTPQALTRWGAEAR